MSEKILVPVLGESITEATVSKWLKNEGEKVEADEPIVELETDKVNLEVPSPVSGVLDSINSKDGSVVEVGAVLGSVSESSTNTNETEEIKKIEPTINENNVVKLEPQKELEEIEEPKIFDEKKQEPLVLTNEVKEKKELNIKIEEKDLRIKKILVQLEQANQDVQSAGKKIAELEKKLNKKQTIKRVIDEKITEVLENIEENKDSESVDKDE